MATKKVEVIQEDSTEAITEEAVQLDKVKALIEFYDVVENYTLRVIGAEFKCTKERADDLVKKGFVEII